MAKKLSAPTGALKIAINGIALTAEKRKGRWQFQCEAWPELEGRFNGSADLDGIMTEFMRLAFARAARPPHTTGLE